MRQGVEIRTSVRYPARAVLAVAATGLLFVFNMMVGFLFMALVPPLIPVFVCILFAGGMLVGNALQYAQRVSVTQRAAMLRGRHEEEDRGGVPSARPTRA